MRLLIFVFACWLAASPAWAQQQRYSTWTDPQGAREHQARMQKFVDRLNALVDQAEQARAADQRFLRDLRALARSFDRPWRVRLFFDDFRDGDFTANPVWTVAAGRFWVERGYGLRSSVTAPARRSRDEGQEKKPKGRDAAIALLGALLNQQSGQQSGQQGGSRPAARRRPVAEIQAVGRISNAFSIELDLISWQGQGRLEFGPFQTGERKSGYRLAYEPGGGLELLRISRRGTSVIESTPQSPALEDGREHRVEWNRHPDGAMTVSLDGKEIFAVADRGFRDPFDGFLLVNRGGDYAVRNLAIAGTE